MDQKPNNSHIEAVIEKWKLEGKDIPLGVVPYHILQLVSRYFPPQEDWKRLASYLGINTIQTLTEIEGDAQVRKEWPSLLALNHAGKCSSQPPTFADLITILQSKLVRLDAIQKLHDSGEVQAFFVMRKCPEEVELAEEKRRLQKTLNNEISGDELDAVLRDLTLKNTNKSKHLTVTKNVPSNTVVQVNACTIEVKPSFKYDKECIATEEKEKNEETKKDSVMEPTIEMSTEPRSRPTKPVVMLTYSSDVNDIVPTVVDRFWSAGIGVVSNYTLRGKGVLESNPNAVWECLFRQCNFVVPIISDKYLEDTNTPDKYCDQSQVVRFIHNLYVNKFVTDGCMNRIVRPLIVSDVNETKLRNLNPTLSYRFVLWRGLDDVINIVKADFEARMQKTIRK